LEAGIDGDAYLEHLAEAVRIRTVSFEERARNDPGDILALHAFLRDTYPLTMQKHCTVEAVNDLSLLITWEGTDPDLDPILLMAHMDTVPVEEGTEDDWEVDPFSGEIVDGELWGRGTLDDKGPLITVMEAVEHLLGTGFEPTHTVLIALGHDEEIGGLEGAKQIAELLRERGVRPWFVVDEGGGVADEIPPLTQRQVALVKTAEKGYLSLELKAVGQGGHSSAPPRSTSIGRIAAAVKRLEAKPFPARVGVLEPLFSALGPGLDPRLRRLLDNLRFTGTLVARVLSRQPATAALIRTTTAVTMISGGVKENVLPQEAWAVVNFRILQGDTTASVTDRVERLVGPGISVEQHGINRTEPSATSSTESAAWDVVRRSVEETYPDALVAPWTLSAATDSRYFADIAGDVYGFASFTTPIDAFDRIHGTGERMRTSDAEQAVSFFCRLIRNAQPS
jgi:carboxypeptidase PM20D1